MGLFDFLRRETQTDKYSISPVKSETQTAPSHEHYQEKIQKEYIRNEAVTKQDLLPYKGKPFSLSGRILFDCGIPYLKPTDNDKVILMRDIDFLVEKIINTGVFKTYKTGDFSEYIQIRTEIYTATGKTKKFPISAVLNDGSTFCFLFYTQQGKLGKAELTYTPNNKQGYTISFKEYSGEIEVRRICSYPIGGGRTSEIYSKS